MENEKPVKPGEEDEVDVESEETKPMPFGAFGMSFLCNALQYALFLGLTMVALMLIRILGPR